MCLVMPVAVWALYFSVVLVLEEQFKFIARIVGVVCFKRLK